MKTKNVRLFSLFLLSISACTILIFSSAWKLTDDEKWTYKIEAKASVFTAEDEKKTEEIYRTRLLNIGIKETDILIGGTGKIITVVISNADLYRDRSNRISNALRTEGRLAFWETYTKAEACKALEKAFGTEAKMKTFTGLFYPTNFDSASWDNSGCLVGYVYMKNMMRAETLIDSLQNLKKLPADLHFMWSVKPNKDYPDTYELLALKSSKNGGPAMDKPKLTDVHVEIGQYSASPEISMTMDAVATKEWAALTKANIGKCLAMVYEGHVYSYPNVNGEITGGKSSITGNFTKKEAEGIASVLKTEPLPSAMQILEINAGK